MNRSAKRRTVARVVRVADGLERLYGRRRRSGKASPPLDTLIGTLLSQNTNDLNSYRAWLNLKRKFPTWEKVAGAPRKAIAEAIEVGGLKNQKAMRIKEILSRVKGDWGSYSLNALRKKSSEEVREYLLSMKGVGEKTAACVLAFSLNRDVFPVDTHIHRICNRLGLVATKSAEETFHMMGAFVPEGRAHSFHVNLIRFGREVCRAGKPLCRACVLFDECLFEKRHAFATSERAASSGKAAGAFLVTEYLSKRHRWRSRYEIL